MPSGITVADVNADGKLDLAVPGYQPNDVALLYGNGSGSFASALRLPAGRGPSGVGVGDFNGDGRPDLAVANADSLDVSVFLADGTGWFGAPTRFVAGMTPRWPFVADVNGDGRADLLVGQPSGLAVLLGDGHGGFADPIVSWIGIDSHAFAFADLNGDGKRDLIAGNFMSNDVAVLFGDGTGHFTEAARYPCEHPEAVAIGDVDEDGVPDLAVSTTNGVVLMRGSGAGTYRPAVHVAGDPDQITTGVALVDLNADHHLDLVVSIFAPGSIAILAGDGSGTFGAPRSFSLAPNTTSSSLQVADFNADGKPDLAAVSFYEQAVDVLLNETIIDFTPPAAPPDLTAAVSHGSVTLTWSAAADESAIAVYDVLRDGVVLAANTTAPFSDPGRYDTQARYAVRARDVADNVGPSSEISVLVPADVVAASASAAGTTHATLTARVLAGSHAATVRLRWGTTAAYGRQTATVSTPAQANQGAAVRFTLTGLRPSTTYHARFEVTTALAPAHGPDLRFTTARDTTPPSLRVQGAGCRAGRCSARAAAWRLVRGSVSDSESGVRSLSLQLVRESRLGCAAYTGSGFERLASCRAQPRALRVSPQRAFTFALRGLQPGRYRLVLTARDRAGNTRRMQLGLNLRA
jgi:hypothetical protein